MNKYGDKTKPFIGLKVFFKKNIAVILLISIIWIIGFGILTHYSLSCIEKNSRGSNIEKEQSSEKDRLDLTSEEYQQKIRGQADRVVDTYDISDKEIKPLIQIPTYKFKDEEGTYEEDYRLSTNDLINVNCSKLQSEFTQVFDIHFCNIYLNSTKVFPAWSWTDNETINPHITIFDNEDLKYPLIVVAQSFGYGSRDHLSVYRVVDNKLVNLLFINSIGESSETWWQDPYTKMYVEDGKEYLVTYFHDPAMEDKYLIRIWEIEGTELKLTETILEKGEI